MGQSIPVNFQSFDFALKKTSSLLDGPSSLSDTNLESCEEQLCAFNELINELNVNIFLKVTIKIIN
jgi:hypothetical protein